MDTATPEAPTVDSSAVEGLQGIFETLEKFGDACGELTFFTGDEGDEKPWATFTRPTLDDEWTAVPV